MIVIIGKSGSGKSTLLRQLLNRGFIGVTGYTTRVKRDNEVDGCDYHFITDGEFDTRERNGEFAEVTSYETINGLVRYATSRNDYLEAPERSVVICNLKGILQLCNDPEIAPKIKILHLKEQNTETLIKRLISRGDDEREVIRRLIDETHMFNTLEILNKINNTEYATIYIEIFDDPVTLANYIEELYNKGVLKYE